MGLDPVVLFFVFGLVAGLLKSELKLPAALWERSSLAAIASDWRCAIAVSASITSTAPTTRSASSTQAMTG